MKFQAVILQPLGMEVEGRGLNQQAQIGHESAATV
jgi:hypothetical protein